MPEQVQRDDDADARHGDPQGNQQRIGSLYVVATPIGHSEDISQRARNVLQKVNCVAAEDTRVSRPLLERMGIRAHLVAAHQHNERQAAQALVERLLSGEDVALISDAGTPAISDPGAMIVAAAHAAGITVVPIPGASAVTALMSAAGIACEGMLFEGFLPSRPRNRDARLADCLQAAGRVGAALVLFEAPHRIEQTLDALRAACGDDRVLAIGRELTKKFEEVHRCTTGEARGWLDAREERRRGEFVLAIAPPAADAARDQALVDDALPLPGAPSLQALLGRLLRELPASRAVRVAQDLTGASRDRLYAIAVALRSDADAGSGEGEDGTEDDEGTPAPGADTHR